MTQVWFYVLVCLSGPICQKGAMPLNPTYQDGRDLSFYSLDTCEKQARIIAKAMHVKDGGEWGYYCKVDDYEPPKLQQDCRDRNVCLKTP